VPPNRVLYRAEVCRGPYPATLGSPPMIWCVMGEFIGHGIGVDYVSVAWKWLQKEKLYGTNIITTVVMRAIWLIRNDMIFNHQVWVDVKMVWRKMLKLTLEWQITFREQNKEEMRK
jgi:hypothetical protein